MGNLRCSGQARNRPASYGTDGGHCSGKASGRQSHHGRVAVLEQEEGGFQVGAHNPLPVVLGGVFRGVGVEHRRVVHQSVQPLPVVAGGFCQTGEVFRVGQVGLHRSGGVCPFPVQFVDQLPGLFLPAAVMDDHIPAPAMEGFGSVGAQAVGSTGDQNNGSSHNDVLRMMDSIPGRYAPAARSGLLRPALCP